MTNMRFKTIAIMGNTADPAAQESIATLVEHLTSRGVKTLVSERQPISGSTASATADDSELAAESDLVIAVGGDGTMLYAARRAVAHKVPVLGINRGRLGFLADVRPEEIQTALDAVLNGNFSSEKRMLLRADILKDGKVVASGNAVNDIVIKRRETARMLDYCTRVNGRYVNTHSGDGFIAATPTGSTAYALSCGGPIIEPSLDAIVLAPICPHTLADRPIVISAHAVTEVEVLQNHGSDTDVSCDGELAGQMGTGDKLRIVVADERIELIHPPGYDYFEALRSKLYWGRDTRNRQATRD